MSSLIDSIASLPPGLLLALVFLMPAAEAGILVGVFVPGETAVLLGGVAASEGSLALWGVIAAAVAGAVIGDQAGYLLGARYGSALTERIPRWLWRPESIERTLDVLRRRGGVAVVVGRWTAALRAFVPGIAGTSGMSHRTFTVANIVGGTTWATAVAVGGYLAGASYHRLEERFGTAGKIVSVVLVVALVLVVAYRHFAPSRHASTDQPAPEGAPTGSGDGETPGSGAPPAPPIV